MQDESHRCRWSSLQGPVCTSPTVLPKGPVTTHLLHYCVATRPQIMDPVSLRRIGHNVQFHSTVASLELSTARPALESLVRTPHGVFEFYPWERSVEEPDTAGWIGWICTPSLNPSTGDLYVRRAGNQPPVDPHALHSRHYTTAVLIRSIKFKKK